MKKGIFLLSLLILTAFLGAQSRAIALKNVSNAPLTVLKTISYGSGSNQVGLYMPTHGEELPTGVNGLAFKDDSLLLLDKMNKRVLSFNLKSRTFSSLFTLPSVTFSKIAFLNSEPVVYDVKQGMLFRQSGNRAVPLMKKTIEEAVRADKRTTYPYTKFVGGGVRLVYSPDKAVTLRFSDADLLSFLLIPGGEEIGSVYAVAQFNQGVRYLLRLDDNGDVLSKTLLPRSEVVQPDQDVVVTPTGVVYYMTVDQAGLRLYKGGVQ